ncbi:MAG: glycosyltransferase [Acidobacteria bacterium]|nr:glycosyltransferase [Acidobacteriota bacterium]
MRIVIDATAAVSGGKVYLNQLLTQFARMNGEDTFTIFHTGDFDDFTVPVSSDRFEFNRISMPVFSGRNWIGSSIVKMLWRLFVLPSHLNRIKPDLLFSNAGFVSGRMISGVKTVLALHNSMPLRSELIAEEKSLPGKLRLIFLKILMGRALASSDGAIVFSHDTRDRVIDTFKHNTKPLFVVYHGIDWG